MQSIDLHGPRLHIRRARVEDAAPSYRWFANPTVTEYLPLAGTGTLPLEEIRSYLARVAVTDRPELAVGIDLAGQGPIGCGGFRNFEGDAAELSLILGEPSAWGQGLGTEALRLLLTFAFGELALARVWLVVRTDNERAVSLFKRFRFVIIERSVGAVVIDGVPRDKFRMELRQETWQRIESIT
jgi:RimJ/RimL family protein N-acetyltransferase